MDEHQISSDEMVWLSYASHEIRNSLNTVCRKLCVDSLNTPSLSNREKYCLQCCAAKYYQGMDIMRNTMSKAK